MNQTDTPKPEWVASPERSHTTIIRLMVWISLRLGRPIGRLILHGITLYFLIFAPAARRASRGYLQRVLGRPPRLIDHYRQVFAFSSTLHDRIYLLNDRHDLFQVEFVGDELIHEATAKGSGVILLGAHMGSFEVLRALGRQRAPVPVAVVMYQENARKFNDVLAAINPAATHDIIPLAQLDSMLRVKDRLDHGCCIGILGDRAPKTDGMATRPFFGQAAHFPTGALRMAALLKKPVFFMVGVYLGGNRYRLHFEPLADFSLTERGQRAQAIDHALDAYVACIERQCRQSPYNWFNFFDFWASANADHQTHHV